MSVITSAYGTRARPGNQIESYSWMFMRVSGLVLLFLVLGHMFVMHIVNNVDTIDYFWVADRWAVPFWRTYDWLILMLSLVHGANGMRVIIDDYVQARVPRTFCHATLWMVTLAFFALGSIVVFTFQPVPRPV